MTPQMNLHHSGIKGYLKALEMSRALNTKNSNRISWVCQLKNDGESRISHGTVEREINSMRVSL